MSRWVEEHADVVLWLDFRQCRTQGDGVRPGLVEVIDPDVQMEHLLLLLCPFRPYRRAVRRLRLEGESCATLRRSEQDPVRFVEFHFPSQQALIEVRQCRGIRAVHDHGRQRETGVGIQGGSFARRCRFRSLFSPSSLFGRRALCRHWACRRPSCGHRRAVSSLRFWPRLRTGCWLCGVNPIGWRCRPGRGQVWRGDAGVRGRLQGSLSVGARTVVLVTIRAAGASRTRLAPVTAHGGETPTVRSAAGGCAMPPAADGRGRGCRRGLALCVCSWRRRSGWAWVGRCCRVFGSASG